MTAVTDETVTDEAVSEEAVSEEIARKIRLHALRITSSGGGSHLGSCYSVADILAVLYGRVMRIFPADPKHPDRDRLVYSKGHASAALYAVLAESGFFPIRELDSFYQAGSLLLGHVSHKVPGIEVSSGALGHGLALAAGMAYSAQLDGRLHRVFAVLSDGELDEGSSWEAVLFAAHHRLKRLTVIVDYNKIQSLDRVEEVLALEPLVDKFQSFGWRVVACDGHHHAALAQALTAENDSAGRPTCVVAHTVKGKGVSFMENTVLWHYRIAKGDEYDAAYRELTAGAVSEQSSEGGVA